MKKILEQKNKLAFTLAEVLITLGIIGVVAAMTMPTLVAHYQKKQLVNQVKTTYTTLQNGIKLLIAKHGCVDEMACTGLFTTKGVSQFEITQTKEYNDKFFEEMKSVFNIIDICDNTNGQCDYFGKYKYLSGDSYLDFSEVNSGWYNAFTLSNGALVGFACSSSKCSVVVDVNGKKKPNQFGRDAYQMSIWADGTIVVDTSIKWAQKQYGEDWQTGASYWRNKPTQCGRVNGEIPSGTTGSNCLARIIEEGWQMNY